MTPGNPLYATIEVGCKDTPSECRKSSRSGKDYAILDVAGPWGVARLWVEEDGSIEVTFTRTLPRSAADTQPEEKWEVLGTWRK